MSKNKISTRDAILSKALEMFNERGIEYVGLRELAATLGIRVSNISYYFPTKDDLVNELTLELNRANSNLLVAGQRLTLKSFLEMMQGVFRNQVRFRSIMLSIVHLMEHNQVISQRHKQTQKDRNKVLAENLKTLAAGGLLSFPDEQQVEMLAAMISLIARFWISEAAISYRKLSEEDQIDNNLRLIVNLLLPYATTVGKEQINTFLESTPATKGYGQH